MEREVACCLQRESRRILIRLSITKRKIKWAWEEVAEERDWVKRTNFSTPSHKAVF